MLNLKELTEKLAAKAKEVNRIYTEAGEDMDFSKVKCIEGDTTAKVEHLRAIDAEVTELKEQRDELIKLDKGRQRAQELAEEMGTPITKITHPGNGDPEPEIKSLGRLFVESKAFTDPGKEAKVDINLKTTMSASAGWDPFAARIPRVELYPLERISVFDLYPLYTTEYDTIKYMKESTFTQNAWEIAEGSAPGTDSAIALTETSDEVEKVITWLPVTDQQLEDVPGLEQYINSRLAYMLKWRIDSQLINGSGTTPYLWGAKNLSSVQTQAKGAYTTPDAFFRAMTKVRGASAATGFAEPSNIIVHPNDWQDIRLLRTADGVYIYGNPTDAGPERMWGVPITVTTAMPENTGHVGDFRGYAALYIKKGITFKVTDSHASYFIYGIQAIKAEIRLAAVYFRDTAFCNVTGI